MPKPKKPNQPKTNKANLAEKVNFLLELHKLQSTLLNDLKKTADKINQKKI